MNEKSKKFALIGDLAGLLGFVAAAPASPAVSWSAIRLPSSCWGAER